MQVRDFSLIQARASLFLKLPGASRFRVVEVSAFVRRPRFWGFRVPRVSTFFFASHLIHDGFEGRANHPMFFAVVFWDSRARVRGGAVAVWRGGWQLHFLISFVVGVFTCCFQRVVPQ